MKIFLSKMYFFTIDESYHFNICLLHTTHVVIKCNFTKVLWAKNYYPHYTDKIGEAQKVPYIAQGHTARKSRRWV